jgi:GTP-binding protein EngB required for normal cell division
MSHIHFKKNQKDAKICRRSRPWVGIHQDYYYYLKWLKTFSRESEGRLSPITIVVVGKQGAGKSSFIKKTFGATDCKTGDGAHPTTCKARVYERIECKGTEHEVTLHIIDSPGLGGVDNNFRRFKKELSQVTNGTADVVFYCISMHDGSRIDSTDVSIIKALTKAFGKGIWKHTLLLLTFANTRDQVSDDEHKLLVEDYAKRFQEILNRAYVFDTPVESMFSEPRPERGTIPAIPVGYDTLRPLPLCSNWPDRLFTEAIVRTDPKVARELLKLKTLNPQEVVEVVGSATAGVAAGAAIGAAAGVPLLAPGVAIGAATGAVVGGTVGVVVPNFLTKLKNMFLLRRSKP